MKKHTPGPWRFRPWKVEEGHAVEFVIDSEDWKQMAMVWAQEEPGADRVLGSGEANARLMAMAPELLQALERIVPCARRYGQRRYSTVDEAMALAVIARAKGHR